MKTWKDWSGEGKLVATVGASWFFPLLVKLVENLDDQATEPFAIFGYLGLATAILIFVEQIRLAAYAKGREDAFVDLAAAARLKDEPAATRPVPEEEISPQVRDLLSLLPSRRDRDVTPSTEARPFTIGTFLRNLLGAFVVIVIIGTLIDMFSRGINDRPHCEHDGAAPWERIRCEENWFVKRGLMKDGDRTIGQHGDALVPHDAPPP